jgi:hypothetical protein
MMINPSGIHRVTASRIEARMAAIAMITEDSSLGDPPSGDTT